MIGAGAVAQRKILSLLEYGATVLVIAPDASPCLRQLSQEGRIVWKQRPYRHGDLQSASLAFCACGIPCVNEAVKREAATCACLLNIADEPDEGDFSVPAVLRRGSLQLAISTSGASPALARKIKADLADCYGDEWGLYIQRLGELRALVLERVEDDFARRRVFQALAGEDLRPSLMSIEYADSEEAYNALVVPILDAMNAEAL